MAKKLDLSYHPEKGYRLQIGYYFTAEGKKSGKVWWFGRIDAREAEHQAGIIRRIYQESCPQGVWTRCLTVGTFPDPVPGTEPVPGTGPEVPGTGQPRCGRWCAGPSWCERLKAELTSPTCVNACG